MASTENTFGIQLDPANLTATTATAHTIGPSSWSNPWNPFAHPLLASLKIKLDHINFLAWKFQVVPSVIGHDFDEILFTGVPPSQILYTGKPNSQFYFQWKRKDQLLLSWLRSSMT
uniref:Retrotransposon Copia-like N-terminal domain-containing protein n=1 Tax=Cannabis sativa TaxID=3483 RepID=A0A803PTS3_CANSA